MDAREIAKTWARNKVITDEWIDDYCKRENLTYENVIVARKSRWVCDDRTKNVGTHIGYELFVCQLNNDTYRYTVITPWQMSEGLCDINGRDDDLAIELLHEVDMLMLEATETVRNERKKAKVVADSAKTTAKAKAKPKDEPVTKEQPKDEPKPAPKRGRGRPKGSKDTKPRKRRTKAEISAETTPEQPKPTPKRSTTRTKAIKPRTKAQIIAEADRIIARIKAEKQKSGEVPVIEEKTPQKRPQAVMDTPKAQRDELGRVPLGDPGMSISGRYAYLTEGPRKYEARTVWTDGERDYILEGKFFVPVPDGTLFSGLETTPAEVLRWRRQHHRA